MIFFTKTYELPTIVWTLKLIFVTIINLFNVSLCSKSVYASPDDNVRLDRKCAFQKGSFARFKYLIIFKPKILFGILTFE